MSGQGDIAPCPFCGHSAAPFNITDCTFVRCGNIDCSALGPRAYVFKNDWAKAQQEAIAAWNTRTEPKP